MNYFGHAAIASKKSEEPAFVLGAMLPDLCAMVQLPCPPLLHPELGAGIQFHLDTDSLFHQTATFIHHNHRVLAEFRALNISRGAARASAHIGVEMLMDARMIQESGFRDAYLEALAWGAKNYPLAGLCQHLHQKAEAVHEASRQRFAERLGHTLGKRPRLAPQAGELEVIADFLGNDREVEKDVPQLLEELKPLYL